MNHHTALSSYLVKPDLSARRKRGWQGFRTQVLSLNRANPKLLSRLFSSLFIWTLLVAAIQYVQAPKNLASQSLFSVDQATFTGTPSGAGSALATVAHAQTLPSGPSGQLLPPGTMASDRTYANNYARGQCTWYVAGRRQIPAGWGNAAQWYYHATSSGWSVGTTPAIAAIAWTPAGAYGHVALVEQVSANGSQVYISEMNYQGLYVKSYRWVSAKAFKYIY